MRIWDLPVQNLCDKHLLGEHRELHAIWTYLTTDKGGSYRKHPETLRWIGCLENLYARHFEQVDEMQKRGFNHTTPLKRPPNITYGRLKLIHTIEEQKEIIKRKGCLCKLK